MQEELPWVTCEFDGTPSLGLLLLVPEAELEPGQDEVALPLSQPCLLPSRWSLPVALKRWAGQIAAQLRDEETDAQSQQASIGYRTGVPLSFLPGTGGH